MSTDLRALCAELTDFLAELPFATCEELVVRARAALASPGSGLPQRPENFEFALDFLGRPENDELLAYVEQLEARAALAADGSAVPEGREPASVVEEPSDEELDDCADELLDWNLEGHRAFARAVLARYGHQPAPPAQRHPAPVPVSERLPGPGDCDELGRCWAWDWSEESWTLCDRTCAANGFTHWLPAHALPLPAGEVGHD